MLIKIIGIFILFAGVALTILSENKKAAVYQYGTVLAKVVEKKSMRDLYNRGELEKLNMPKYLLKFSEFLLKRKPRGPEFRTEKKIFPVYEYEFQGSTRRIQSYCESYCPKNKFETIYLDGQGNVNDAYVRSKRLKGVNVLITYGLSVLLLQFFCKESPLLAAKYNDKSYAFIFIGAVGLSALLSGFISITKCVKHKRIKTQVKYNDSEASFIFGNSVNGRVSCIYYPVVKYEYEGKTIWHRCALGMHKNKYMEKIEIDIDCDGVIHECTVFFVKIFIGNLWLTVMYFLIDKF